MQYDITHYQTITSTNTILKEMARQGEIEGKVLVADEQTQGRGRLGREFYSPQNSGLYMSILLKPMFAPNRAVNLTALTGVCVVEAIKQLVDVECKIKWVNDIFVDGKKICGILTESALNSAGSLDYVVVGIGINLTEPDGGFPEQIRNVASSLECDTDIKSDLINLILSKFDYYYSRYESNDFVPRYQQYSLLDGMDVDIVSPDNERTSAKALYIDEQCRLVLRIDESGEQVAISSGEVSIRMR